MNTRRLLFLVVAAVAPVFVSAQNPDPWASKVEAVIGGAPADLLGEWTKSHVSTVDFVNPNTGSHADPSGERLNVRFFPDGHYRLGWLLQSSLYNCTSTVFGDKTGTYQVLGNSLTMKDAASVLTSKDTCHREWNYEKHPPLLQSTYQWRFGRTKYGSVLILRGPDGKENIYARETGPGLLNR